MIEPKGYVKMWQKFENDVYGAVKRSLDSRFVVRWSYQIDDLKPDVAVLMKCSSIECGSYESPCLIPAFLFDAYCKFNIEKKYFAKKDKQMKKYAKICDSILVMPKGYEQRPYCVSTDGKYHIVSYTHLGELLRFIHEEAKVRQEEASCGDRPACETGSVYGQFELSLRSRVDRCPNCESKVVPASLIHCLKHDRFYHADLLDSEEVRHYVVVPTYVECSDCELHDSLQLNYDDCGETTIVPAYQCSKCGAVSDPETNKIIKNFDEGHLSGLEESSSYYAELGQQHKHL